MIVYLACKLSAQTERYAIRSALSWALARPPKAMAFPGAKAAGFWSHLFRLAADHLRVALDERADE